MDKISIRYPNFNVFIPMCKYWGIYCSVLDTFIIIQWKVRVSPEMIVLGFSRFHIYYDLMRLFLKSFNYIFAYCLSINVLYTFLLKIFIFSTLTKTCLQEFLLTIFAAIVIKDSGLQINKPTEMREALLLERPNS